MTQPTNPLFRQPEQNPRQYGATFSNTQAERLADIAPVQLGAEPSTGLTVDKMLQQDGNTPEELADITRTVAVSAVIQRDLRARYEAENDQFTLAA